MAGLYVHIPFCESRCIYCGFYSTTLSQYKSRYVEALCRELSIRCEELTEPINTIYIGGGTPSRLTTLQLQRLFEYIYNNVSNINVDAEVTMECNPDDITPQFSQCISALPVNRISMGVQTFDDDRLTFLHRRHNSAQVICAVEHLRNVGISNISIDLMFGFPNQTIDMWKRDIDEALHLEVEHISAYSLMYEENTPLYVLKQSGKVTEIAEEDSLRMYDALCDTLCANGYEHYEISNFAKQGYRSRHNNSYWTGEKYIGIGAAAHSYDVGSRSWNVANVLEYIEMAERGRRPLDEIEIVDDITHYNDTITTALRTKEGVDINTLNEKFKEHIIKESKQYIDMGLLKTDGCHISLTRKGIYVSDGIMSDLMFV